MLRSNLKFSKYMPSEMANPWFYHVNAFRVIRQRSTWTAANVKKVVNLSQQPSIACVPLFLCGQTMSIMHVIQLNLSCERFGAFSTQQTIEGHLQHVTRGRVQLSVNSCITLAEEDKRLSMEWSLIMYHGLMSHPMTFL